MPQPECTRPDLHKLRLADLAAMSEEEFEAFEQTLNEAKPDDYDGAEPTDTNWR